MPDDDPCVEDFPHVRHRRPDPEPSESQRFEHSLTHLPYKSWCPVCVGARGRSDPHRQATTATTEIPQISFDFAFFREGRGTHTVPVLVGVDKDTACLFAYALPSKSGALPGWLPSEIERSIRDLGHHGSIILKGDRENSLVSILHQVARLRGGRTQIERNATADSQSNGRAERAVQSIEMMTRTFKLDLEARVSACVPVDIALFTWLVRHAADVYNKRQIGRDHMTPYQRIRGRVYAGELVRFAAPVLYRISGPVQGG